MRSVMLGRLCWGAAVLCWAGCSSPQEIEPPSLPSGDAGVVRPNEGASQKPSNTDPAKPQGCDGQAVFGGPVDALFPDLAPMDGVGREQGDWWVGWTLDDGRRSRVVISTLEGARECVDGAVLSKADKDAFGLRVASTGQWALVVWSQVDGDKTQVMAQPLTAKGARPSDPVVLAQGSTDQDRPGLPEVVSLPGQRFAAVWTQGKEVVAVRLTPEADVEVTARWPGGNLRPSGPINGPNTQKTRANPSPQRPRLLSGAKALEVVWGGTIWISDDQLTSGWYRASINWQTKRADDMDVLGRLPSWHSWASVAGQGMALASVHNSNGGPWELAAVKDGQVVPGMLTTEPAGPLSATLLTSKTKAWALWSSVSAGGVMARPLNPTTAEPLPGPPTLLPSAAPKGELDFEAVAYGDGVMVAFVDRVQVPAKGGLEVSRSVIRVEPLRKARQTQPVAYTKPQMDYTSKPSPTGFVSAGLDDGARLVAWRDYWSNRIEALWVRDDGSVALEDRFGIGPKAPRYGGPSVASMGDRALLALNTCANDSICENPKVFLASLKPGQKPVTRSIAFAKEPNWPTIAVEKTAKGRWRAALTAHLSMGSGSVVRVAEFAKPDDVFGALAKAPIVPVRTDARVLSAVWHQGALVMVTAPANTDGPTQLLTLKEGRIQPGLILDDRPYAVWGQQRLASSPQGLLLLAQRHRQGLPSDVVLHRLNDQGSAITGTTVLGRGHGLSVPSLAVGAQGQVGVYWSDRASDGSYVAWVTPELERLAGPVRLDDPAIRSSRPQGIVWPQEERWRALWMDHTHFKQRELDAARP